MIRISTSEKDIKCSVTMILKSRNHLNRIARKIRIEMRLENLLFHEITRYSNEKAKSVNKRGSIKVLFVLKINGIKNIDVKQIKNTSSGAPT